MLAWMGIMSGGVFTVSKVGVSAVTYIPYSGYSDTSVVIASTPHTRSLRGLQVRRLILDIAPQQSELDSGDRRHHDEQHKRLRGSDAIPKLHESVLVNLGHDHLGAVAN